MTRGRERERDDPPARRGADRLDRRRGDEFLGDVSLNCESSSESGIVVLGLRLCLILEPSEYKEGGNETRGWNRAWDLSYNDRSH